MTNPLDRLIRGRRRPRSFGQSVVELALILPILLLVVMIALDFGRIYLGWVQMNNAARIGANYAALHPNAWPMGNVAERTNYQNQVSAELTGANCTSPGPVPDPTFPGGKSVGGAAVVGLTCTFRPLTPLIGEFLGNSIKVSVSSTFPIRAGALFGPPVPPAPGVPLAQFIPDPPSGPAPLAVHFTDVSVGTGITVWFWQFGDGSTSSAAGSTNHTYSAQGSYTARLTITNSVGSSSFETTIVVGAPLPSPTPTPTGPTPTPTTTPSPSPTATVKQCIVPSFVGTDSKNAKKTWTDAGFGANAISFVPNGPDFIIGAQLLVGGSVVPCSASITLYQNAPSPSPTPPAP